LGTRDSIAIPQLKQVGQNDKTIRSSDESNPQGSNCSENSATPKRQEIMATPTRNELDTELLKSDRKRKHSDSRKVIAELFQK